MSNFLNLNALSLRSIPANDNVKIIDLKGVTL